MILFEAMEENLRATMAVFGRAHPSGETRQLPGVAVTSSGVQFSMFNSALLTAPVSSAAELDERVQRAAAFFSSLRMPWSFWVCQGWIDKDARNKVSAVFDYHRLHLAVELPGMIAEHAAPPSRMLPALTVRRVRDRGTRADFAHIMSVAFGIPMSIARLIYESECTWNGDFVGYVGYLDDLPVSSTATVVTSSVMGIYAVGTLPTHRRHGCAEAVMRYAMAAGDAQHLLDGSMLQSSEAGLSLYQKMGYRTLTRYAVFAT